MVPKVDASGQVTVTTTTYWRKGGSAAATPSIPGVSLSQSSSTSDTSDSRFDVLLQTHTGQLQSAGTHTITWGSSARVGGVNNAAEAAWSLTSKIHWDGSRANTPIYFDLGAVQPEVVQGENYVGSLGAVPGSGVTLSYDQALALNITSQPPGFSVDPATGDLSIPSADVATWQENTGGNAGADYAFSGNIFASDGSRVQFDWLFDLVSSGAGVPRAPVITNGSVSATSGQTVSYQFTGTDANGDTLTWSFLDLLGDEANAAAFDPATRTLTWDSTGTAAGTYVVLVRASDGSKSDTGQLTITLGAAASAPAGTPAPEPPKLGRSVVVDVTVKPGTAPSAGATPPAPPTPSGYARTLDVVLTIAAPPDAGYVWIANDPEFATGKLVPVDEAGRYDWRLLGDGPRKVYVRFVNEGGASPTLEDDVLVDATAPSLLSATFVGAGRRPQDVVLTVSKQEAKRMLKTRQRSWITVQSTDDLSGLQWMQYAPTRTTPFAWRSFIPRASVRVRRGATFVWLRVADRAGNVSRWMKVPIRAQVVRTKVGR